MITTVAYPGYQQNPPGISFIGKKTWSPGKSLGKFIAAAFGVSVKAQVEIVEAISDAVSDIAPRVREAMTRYAAFEDIGRLGQFRAPKKVFLGSQPSCCRSLDPRSERHQRTEQQRQCAGDR
jgi:hypothetical protein